MMMTVIIYTHWDFCFLGWREGKKKVIGPSICLGWWCWRGESARGERKTLSLDLSPLSSLVHCSPRTKKSPPDFSGLVRSSMLQDKKTLVLTDSVLFLFYFFWFIFVQADYSQHSIHTHTHTPVSVYDIPVRQCLSFFLRFYFKSVFPAYLLLCWRCRIVVTISGHVPLNDVKVDVEKILTHFPLHRLCALCSLPGSLLRRCSNPVPTDGNTFFFWATSSRATVISISS